MTNFRIDDAEDKQDNLEKMEGRIRAIEAILLELPEINPDLVRAAKDNLRRKWKSKSGNRRMADLLDQMNGPYDEHAEAALDALIPKAEGNDS